MHVHFKTKIIVSKRKLIKRIDKNIYKNAYYHERDLTSH